MLDLKRSFAVLSLSNYSIFKVRFPLGLRSLALVSQVLIQYNEPTFFCQHFFQTFLKLFFRDPETPHSARL